MTYEPHLYAILYPNEALVASQYNYEQFARHYVSGSTRYYDGKVIFAELDTEFRNDFFDVQYGLDGLVPHDDGRPKATKFISVYRVVEHLDFNLIKHVYLTTPEAAVLQLDFAEAHDIQVREQGLLRIYAEIAPLRMLVLTKLNFTDFGIDVTSPGGLRAVPAQFYTQLQFDAQQFLKDFSANPLMPPPIAGLHPSKLRDAILEIEANPNKPSKSLALDANLNRISYRYIRHGFMFARQQQTHFFQMPTSAEIEEENLKFWRAM